MQVFQFPFQQCIVKEYANDKLEKRYDLGCESKMVSKVDLQWLEH